MELPSRRRLVSTVLAVVLAAESVSAVAAVAGTTASTRHPLPDAVPAGTVLAERAATPTAARAPGVRLGWSTDGATREDPASPFLGPVRTTRPAAPAAPVAPARPEVTTPAKATTSRPTTKAATQTTARSTTVRYVGRNHVWIPSLGINRSVHWFSCDRQRPPDNYVYRWGCAGRNNVYLLGHAYSVFKPLHDAYVSGRLRKGMKAVYADGNGKVHTYAVIWWKLTRPTTEASWAWAPQAVPSMTLQTCVGANSEYRLMVRLTEIR